MSRVQVEISDHIARVTMTRADKMNALDAQMIEGLITAGESLLENDDLRAVVLSGEGAAFCAGLDIMSFATFAGQAPNDLLMPRSHGMSNRFQRVAMVWRDIPVPVIAALHGVCYGGGMQIALGADMRIAQPETKLAIMEMKWGLIPDMGGMALLPALMRADQMRQMIYTAAPVLAPEAQNMGLVTELSETPLERALELASQIAGKSPSAVRAAKAICAYAEGGATTEEVLLEESRAQATLIGKPHQMEVIAANMQKRAAKFT